MEAYRQTIMASRLIMIEGHVQAHDNVIHVVAQHLEDYSHRLDGLSDNGAATETVRPPAHARAAPQPEPIPHSHPRNVRIVPKSRDFH